MAIQLVIMLICGVLGATIAAKKGRSAVGWFFGGFFFSLVGIIIVAVLPNLKEEREHRARMSEENRRLREQLRQERIKSEAFRHHTVARLDTHDNVLGVDTRSVQALPAADPPPARLTAGASASQPQDPPPSDLWYYEVQGESAGPVSATEIRRLLAAREIESETLLWSEDLGEWTPLSRIPTFRTARAR